MGLNWVANDYFSMLILKDKKSHVALEMLVDDLHSEKERTIAKFLQHSGSEDFLWGLVRLLGNGNSRVAGNSAYILGTLAESEIGSLRVIGLTDNTSRNSNRILVDLTNMLTFDDSESVMNAAGTMGTLAESQEGRMWMLGETCLDTTITHITELLANDNLWTASNAALVLARLTIAEEGCERILRHEHTDRILSKLIISLGVDEAGRGMNSAFAIGRLCDMEIGRCKLLSLPESEKMISSLAKMLCCTDPGASKNSCFALSCLATNKDGHSRLLRNVHAEEVLKTLSDLLSAEDPETGWFAAMTLRTLASQPKGCLKLRDHPSVVPSLKAVQTRSDLNPDLLEEVSQTLFILKKLDQPAMPKASVMGPHDIDIEWEEMSTKSGFSVKYMLFEGSKCIHTGKELAYKAAKLRPHTQYTYRVRAFQEGDESPLSDPVTLTTDESAPGPPSNVRILGATTTQLKIGWEAPEKPNGAVRGYYVYNDRSMTEHTTELSSIISGLQPSTSYELCVCAATAKGKGPKEVVCGSTTELGAHAPTKPDVSIRGRNQLHIAWKPPEVPLGRISRYDVSMNGDVVYSGTDLHFTATRLRPDTEYAFTVSAITSEGRCESKVSKKRTAKDEFEVDRAPLYQTPKKEPEVDKKDDPPSPPKAPPKKKRATPISDPPPKSAVNRSGSAASIKGTYKLSYTHGEQMRKEKYTISETSVPPTKSDSSHSSSGSKQHHRPKSTSTNPFKSVQQPVRAETKKEIVTLENGHSVLSPKSAEMPERLAPNLAQVQAWEFSLRSYTPEEPNGRPHSCYVVRVGTINIKSKTIRLQKMVNSMSAKTRKSKEEDELTLPSVTTGENLALSADHSVVATKSGRTHVLPRPRPPKNTSQLKPAKHGGGTVTMRNSGIKREGHHHQHHPSEGHRTREGNDIMTVEIGKKHARHAHGGGHEHGSRADESSPSGRVLSRRSSIRSSLSLEADAGELSELKDHADHHHVTWPSPPKRSEFPITQDTITRTFSTLGQNNYRPTGAQPRAKPGMTEFDAPLPHPVRGNGPPGYVQRANTFIASHRPGTRKNYERRGTNTGGLVIPGSSSHQWKPDLPSSHADRNHNKFVPMQLRTQPGNLPGSVSRSKTMMQGDGVALDLGNAFGVGAISRSNTDLGYPRASHHTHTEEIVPEVSHASQKFYKERSTDIGGKMRSVPKSGPGPHHPETAVMSGFALGSSALVSDSNKLQGAR